MNADNRPTGDRDGPLDTFAAELTSAAYRVALRHAPSNSWIDLELELWRALGDVVKRRRELSPPDTRSR